MININLTAGKGESIQHATIKKYLVEFLRSKAGEGEFCKLSFVSWRVNRPGPCFGVWEEYPFFNKQHTDINGANDEEFDLWDGCTDKELWEETKAYLSKTKTKIEFIADIAVQHKGYISHVFEIVKGNPPSAKKLKFYRENNITCCTVNAFSLYDILLRKGILTEKDFMKNIKND
jgi:hypothetical protein